MRTSNRKDRCNIQGSIHSLLNGCGGRGSLDKETKRATFRRDFRFSLARPTVRNRHVERNGPICRLDRLAAGRIVCLNKDGYSIVISGVTWSKPDLEVLDELAARDTNGTRVWFFNPDYVFLDDRILPGAPRMVTTPALAEYTGEQLVSFVQGGSISGGVIDGIRKLFPTLSSKSGRDYIVIDARNEFRFKMIRRAVPANSIRGLLQGENVLGGFPDLAAITSHPGQ